jgi:hypothetical protein
MAHFRIDMTLYIYPDDILPNAHKLKGRARAIEDEKAD